MKIAKFLAPLLFLTGCYVGTGVVHTVGRGETLWRISNTYGVDAEEVADLNNISDPAEIRAGQKLFIPGVRKPRRVVPNVELASVKRDREEKIVVEKGRFIWPLRGTVSSGFGLRGGERHDGVDIRAPRGTEIKASDDGVVVVNDFFRAYGNIIILEHRNGYYTVYAHNKKNLVAKGDRVSRGQTIASVGDSGNATGYHLHFEVRKGKKTLNPLFYLP